MGLRELFFGSPQQKTAYIIGRNPSVCDAKVVDRLWVEGILNFHGGKQSNEVLFRVLLSEGTTASEKKEVRRRLRESMGIGDEPVGKDWG